MSSKAAEAEAHISAANKCMKTSLLKWKPDVDGAIYEYQKAATCYRNAREIQKAAEIYKKVAELQESQNAIFHCAKSLEQAALLYKELKKWDEICPLFMKAAQFLRENGSVDTATVCLERGAQILEINAPQDAARLYDLAADTAEFEEKLKQSADSANNCARMFIRVKDYNEAAKQLERRIGLLRKDEQSNDTMSLMSKTAVALLVVHLAKGDSVAAKLAVEKVGASFSTGDDAGPVGRLLNAYEAGNEEAAKAALDSPTFKYLENDFVKLARDIKIPQHDAAAGAASDGGDPLELMM